MQHFSRFMPRRLLLLGSVVMLFGCGLLSVAFFQPAAETDHHDLANAQTLWDARPFSRYHMTIQNRYCHQEVAVEGERVVEVFRNTCDHAAWTVADLFALVERDNSISQRCIAVGCACDDVLTVRAEYDAQLGYPRIIKVQVEARSNLQHPDYWNRAWSSRSLAVCDNFLSGFKTIVVHSLTPIF